MSLFSSKGLKRKIVAYLQMLLEALVFIPGAEVAAPVLAKAIGALGGVAVIHAGAAGDVSGKKLLSLTSLLSLLVLLSDYVPALQPYKPLLQELATLFAAGSIGASLKK